MGNHRSRVDSADHPLDGEREHGRDRFYHQFDTLALRKYTSVAGGFATANVATARARRSGIVLWFVPDDVGVESVDEIKTSTDYTALCFVLSTLYLVGIGHKVQSTKYKSTKLSNGVDGFFWICISWRGGL